MGFSFSCTSIISALFDQEKTCPGRPQRRVSEFGDTGNRMRNCDVTLGHHSQARSKGQRDSAGLFFDDVRTWTEPVQGLRSDQGTNSQSGAQYYHLWGPGSTEEYLHINNKLYRNWLSHC